MHRFTIIFCFSLLLSSGAALAQDSQPAEKPLTEPEMTLSRLGNIILAIDPEAKFRGNAVELTIDDVPVLIVIDTRADRMRAMVPIRSAEGLEPDKLLRLMQANFDSALDARYAVAQGRLWGVFIHPLSPLQKDQLLSALVQTVGLARTFGTTYSGGANVFGGGDSNQIYRDLLEELQQRGEVI
ncbi:MAG: hypothetical protein L3J36_11170 [Rhodobacteraceae bacterium]|nr:hypothetical protein [Paracoccaceae bacterium]